VTRERRRILLETIERYTEIPLLGLAAVFAVIIVVPLVVEMDPEWNAVLDELEWLIWGIFLADLSVKTYLAESRLEYLKRNWFAVITVALPFLRPLRVLRLLRLLRVVVVFAAVSPRFLRFFTLHGLHKALAVIGVVIAASAGLVTYFERDAGGPIKTIADGLWWALATVTTVGYGDAYPVTLPGRGVAVFLMLVGIAWFGIVTANLAAFLVEPGEDKLSEVVKRLDRIEAMLAAHIEKSENGSQEEQLRSIAEVGE
jgi:voltage-gated potassium channel